MHLPALCFLLLLYDITDMATREETIKELARAYNNPIYFETDPIIFPKHFHLLRNGKQGLFKEAPVCSAADITLQDVEIAGLIAAHLAWGRRDMIVRDTKRAMEEMGWQPYKYVMGGKYRNSDTSLHRTVKWSEFARICQNMREYYSLHESVETLTADQIRVRIYGQKSDLKTANKKIHMFRRWMVRDDGIVDLGLWKKTSPTELVIPLDVHVHRSALNLGITGRRSCDLTTALQITQYLKMIFPDDPCLGDFALFAYAASTGAAAAKKEKATK